jgi:hypothetical protein
LEQAVILPPAAGNLATPLKPATRTEPCRRGLSPADGIIELPADRPKQPESTLAAGSGNTLEEEAKEGPAVRSPGVFAIASGKNEAYHPARVL